MPGRRRFLVVVLAAGALSACGSGKGTATATGTVGTTTASATASTGASSSGGSGSPSSSGATASSTATASAGTSSSGGITAGSSGGPPEILDGLWLTTPLEVTPNPVARGQTLSATAVLFNPTGTAITLTHADIAARPPGGTNDGGPFDDIHDGASVTVEAGRSFTLTGTRAFTHLDPPGHWYAYVTVADLNGNFHDSHDDVPFTVSPSLSSSSSGSSSSSQTSSSSGSSSSSSGNSGSSSSSTGGNSSSSSSSGAVSQNFYVYQDGVLSPLWQTDLSFGSPVENLQDATHPEAGHTEDFSFTNSGYGGWQPASSNFSGAGGEGIGPFGWDSTPYTYLTLDLWPADGGTYDMQWHYIGDVTGSTTDTVTAAYLSSITDWTGPMAAGQWNPGLKIPLAAVGQLGNASLYKFFLRDNTSASNTFYADNVGFVPGSYAWVYNGGAGPAAGWSDASTGATANYAYVPTARNADLISLNGPTSPGNTAASTNAIQLSVTTNGGQWKATASGGFDITPYDYFTFGADPTQSGYHYKVVLFDTSGTPVGSLVDPTPYTGEDWGPSTQFWTVYCIPLSAFGTVGSTIGGVGIIDASGASTDTLDLSAIGFYR